MVHPRASKTIPLGLECLLATFRRDLRPGGPQIETMFRVETYPGANEMRA